MSVRRAIVEVDLKTVNVAEFCRCHGISRFTFYNVRRRYDADGEAGLASKSRAPRRVANRTPAGVEDAIVAKRKELDDVGLDCGADTIAFHLRDVPGLPSITTIWRVLTARGLITPTPAKAPKQHGTELHRGASERMLGVGRHRVGACQRQRGQDLQCSR